ncbi:hypothetical protein LEP1GSC195_0941 [Leptospira wolbachii serovar Codice str. CDC]|uniref:Uncharacterized protein n=2 Tax=Leptospira TaxID=171 RepID=N1WH59_9LEPT|nr:hypothetical protein LEP1GSC017_0482 [Leptospira meyeri serovar Hardjo str. Went 5]EMY71191.1 hypothetical protein LEP1GSC199_0592 [Leptospira vanthielii serovar Holland str. Waz Holland = ATCC 700522]EMY71638.1 hypothetical protein LEP1GSC199_0575 [Leptospira vanthielii serovar Holland str. Waz Holland = ATCC 700522]EOQ97865.1 hypothetical protein LEP1GSC195_0941 [Leptospira wolbachii serovar Codice str. CDC]
MKTILLSLRKLAFLYFSLTSEGDFQKAFEVSLNQTSIGILESEYLGIE